MQRRSRTRELTPALALDVLRQINAFFPRNTLALELLRASPGYRRIQREPPPVILELITVEAWDPIEDECTLIGGTRQMIVYDDMEPSSGVWSRRALRAQRE